MKLRILLAIVAASMFAVSVTARADAQSDLKAQVDALQRQLDAVKKQLDAVTADMKKVQAEEKETRGAPFLERKPGDALTFLAPGGGEVTLYGNLDVSFDYATKGLDSSYAQGGSPLGKMGWTPDIATNLSYVGVRGTHPLMNTNFIWQLEAGIDISATPGTKRSTSNESDAVNGAIRLSVALVNTEYGRPFHLYLLNRIEFVSVAEKLNRGHA